MKTDWGIDRFLRYTAGIITYFFTPCKYLLRFFPEKLRFPQLCPLYEAHRMQYLYECDRV